MASVRWTVGAREDLQGIVTFIGRHSEIYSAALATRIVLAVDRLEAYPMLGRMVPEYNQENLREIIVGNYRVVYKFDGPDIGIVAVSHGSRNLVRRLGAEPWDFQ
jgi:plasmid stabilization system protein ParE